MVDVESQAQTLLRRLNELARNLWWSWQPDVIAIFRDLDPALWRAKNHNPIAFLRDLPLDVLARKAEETALESQINHAFRRLEDYLESRSAWGSRVCGVLGHRPVAYFAAEFGIHESLPIYSGGLGVLAGDHLKSASDLGVPLVGVGIFYNEGYFRQGLRADGWQLEGPGDLDPDVFPMRRATTESGEPLLVEVELDGELLRLGAWRADVGRASLVLLDSDIAGNTPENRKLTAQLYGGDERTRIRQEIILGIGGVRMLAALGIDPGVLHMNEGHSAFAALELARNRAERDGISFADAYRQVSLRSVFTTHTPVPAGHDRFNAALVLEHLGWLQRASGLDPRTFLGLGRVNPEDDHEGFCMTVLALKSSRHANGVSALHGHVTRQMWHCLWPHRPEAEVPIGHITNGVHSGSWLAPQMMTLYDHYLGKDWRARVCEPETWNDIHSIEDAALWEAHQVLKRRMLSYVARKLEKQMTVSTVTPSLSGDLLTICFARRFAEYKRADLLFSDMERLIRLVTQPGRGLQVVFAGKAHPKDDRGKGILQHVIEMTRDPRLQGRIHFIVDYDIGVGRHMVQGCDVWLNNPRRPQEACGTSGEKAILNGGLNASILDGWWAEAYDGHNGFAIGDDHVHSNPDVQSERDAESLYTLLESKVVPMYYERDADDVPRRWVAHMKHAVASLAHRFNADRMVRDYVTACYLPAAGGVTSLMPKT